MLESQTVSIVIAGIAAFAGLAGVVVNYYIGAFRSKDATDPVISVKGDNTVIHTGKGDINIGMRKETLQKILSAQGNQTNEQLEEFRKLHASIVSRFETLRAEQPENDELKEAIQAFNNGDVEKAIFLRQKIMQTQEENITENYKEIGELYRLKFDYKRALAWYKKAKKTAITGDYDYDIAQLYIKLGEYEKSEKLLKQLANRSESLLEHGIYTAYSQSWIDYIEMLIINKKQDEAELAFHDVIEKLAEYGEKSELYIGMFEGIKAKLGSNLKSHEEHLEVIEERFGAFHYNVIAPSNDLAQLYDQDEQYNKAAFLYEKIVQIFKSRRDDTDHNLLGIVNINYAFNQLNSAEYDKANELLNQAFDNLGSGHPFIANVLPKAIDKLIEAQSFKNAKQQLSKYREVLMVNENENQQEIESVDNVLKSL